MSLGRRLRRWWQEAQWPVMLVIGVVSIVLGIVGWRQQLDAAGIDADPVDAFYLTVQLFTLQVSGVPDANGFPLALQIARFLAPAVAGWAAARAFLAVFRETSQRLSVRFARDHVVVCGLGDTGLRMVQSLRADDRKVVAVERDDGTPSIAGADAAGARVVVGDARDPHLLGRLALDRATHVLALCGDDAVNGEVALAVADRVGRREGSALDCRVHVGDLGLAARLRTRELGTVPTPGVDIDFFNLYEAGARTMLLRHPPFDPSADAATVAVIGDGQFVRAVVVELARRWSVGERAEPLELLLVDPAGDAVATALELRFPGLSDLCTVRTIGADPESPRLASMLRDHGVVDATYVCLDDEVDGLAVGLGLTADGDDRTVVVVTERDAGLGTLVAQRAGHGEGGFTAFGLLDAACDPDRLFGGLWETLAQTIHDDYVASARRRGETPATNPSVVPWSELDESLRQANRDQARHIGTKLEAIGATAVPIVTAGAEDVRLTDDEIERLAELEHERWCDDRRRSGWTLGHKDVQRRVSPHLVDWDELDDSTKELDRDSVRNLPRLLALVGHRIARDDGP